MFYKVIAYFGPRSAGWKKFAGKHWIQPLLTFDSVDGILCPNVFIPGTEEDWAHCVAEDFKINLITDLNYAKRIWQSHLEARLVGVEENKNCDLKNRR